MTIFPLAPIAFDLGSSNLETRERHKKKVTDKQKIPIYVYLYKGRYLQKKSHRNLKLSETKMCNKNIKYSIFDSVYTKRTYQKERNEMAIQVL